MPNPVGRPKIYTDPDELAAAVDEFIKSGDKTLTGLCIHLGFSSKDTLYNYRKDPIFSDSIKAGLLHVENGYELITRDKGHAGSIFALKNFGWTDKSEVDMNTTVNIVNRTISVEETNA